LQLYEKALNLTKSNAELYHKKGLCLRALYKYKESIECFDEVLRIEPTHLAALNFKGLTLKALKLDCNDFFSKANDLNSNPETLNQLLNKAISLHGLERNEEALHVYDRMIAIDSSDPVVFNNRGVLLKIMNRFDEALKSYERSYQIQPSYCYSYNNKGILLKDCLKKNKEAIEYFDKAIEKYPTYADAYKNKASAFYNLKNYQEAFYFYEKAIQFNHVGALNFKGFLIGNQLESEPWFEKALELNEMPTNAEDFKNKGLSLDGLNKYEEAISCFDEAIQMNSNDAK